MEVVSVRPYWVTGLCFAIAAAVLSALSSVLIRASHVLADLRRFAEANEQSATDHRVQAYVITSPARRSFETRVSRAQSQDSPTLPYKKHVSTRRNHGQVKIPNSTETSPRQLALPITCANVYFATWSTSAITPCGSLKRKPAKGSADENFAGHNSAGHDSAGHDSASHNSASRNSGTHDSAGHNFAGNNAADSSVRVLEELLDDYQPPTGSSLYDDRPETPLLTAPTRRNHVSPRESISTDAPISSAEKSMERENVSNHSNPTTKNSNSQKHPIPCCQRKQTWGCAPVIWRCASRNRKLNRSISKLSTVEDEEVSINTSESDGDESRPLTPKGAYSPPCKRVKLPEPPTLSLPPLWRRVVATQSREWCVWAAGMAFASLLCPVCSAVGIALAPASLVISTTPLGIILNIPFAYVFLGESLTSLEASGCAATAVGITFLLLFASRQDIGLAQLLQRLQQVHVYMLLILFYTVAGVFSALCVIALYDNENWAEKTGAIGENNECSNELTEEAPLFSASAQNSRPCLAMRKQLNCCLSFINCPTISAPSKEDSFLLAFRATVQPEQPSLQQPLKQTSCWDDRESSMKIRVFGDKLGSLRPSSAPCCKTTPVASETMLISDDTAFRSVCCQPRQGSYDRPFSDVLPPSTPRFDSSRSIHSSKVLDVGQPQKSVDQSQYLQCSNIGNINNIHVVDSNNYDERGHGEFSERAEVSVAVAEVSEKEITEIKAPLYAPKWDACFLPCALSRDVKKPPQLSQKVLANASAVQNYFKSLGQAGSPGTKRVALSQWRGVLFSLTAGFTCGSTTVATRLLFSVLPYVIAWFSKEPSPGLLATFTSLEALNFTDSTVVSTGAVVRLAPGQPEAQLSQGPFFLLIGSFLSLVIMATLDLVFMTKSLKNISAAVGSPLRTSTSFLVGTTGSIFILGETPRSPLAFGFGVVLSVCGVLCLTLGKKFSPSQDPFTRSINSSSIPP